MSSSSLTNNNNYPSSYDDSSSWEEQAFAKDAAGLGCIWPPRSYSCSFCRREFRSAQALGGHMNVHRRDRARLNQQQPSSPKPNEILIHHHDLQTNNLLTSSSGYIYPSSLCGLTISNTNPNNSDPTLPLPLPLHLLASSPSNIALNPSVVNKSFREETLIPLYNSSSILHNTSSPAHQLSSKSWSNLAESGVERNSKGLDSGCKSKGNNNDTTTDVAVSLNLNLFVCRAYKPVQFETKEGDVIDVSIKKKRKAEASSIPFFPTKSGSVDDTNHIQSQMFEFSPSSIEELDLELRLGHWPKV
ncbi:hypothetical protein RIF29_30261 [Crotalaria pallida]|uniref:C2H2-type domain-containing protein n=1 Tax=Crotalaria pallida TaxID=3830 RepID=A0AAN9EG84_CROPI